MSCLWTTLATVHRVATTCHIKGACAAVTIQLVALLVHHQFTLEALEALTAQAPDSITTEDTEGFAVETLRLIRVTVHMVHFTPSPSTTTVYRFCNKMYVLVGQNDG